MVTNYSAASEPGQDVLIVEDDPVQRDEMAGFLARVGLKVTVAHSYSAALTVVKTISPKVIVLDCNLPDGSGIDLAEILRGMFPQAAIMLASALVEGLSEETLQKLRITVFLNKPLPLVAWRQAVVRLVREGVPAVQKHGWFLGGVGSPRDAD
jgi:CheY-like chemotaxis protein